MTVELTSSLVTITNFHFRHRRVISNVGGALPSHPGRDQILVAGRVMHAGRNSVLLPNHAVRASKSDINKTNSLLLYDFLQLGHFSFCLSGTLIVKISLVNQYEFNW